MSGVDSSRPTSVPTVFLSYTAADRPLAEKIAHALMANGIDTWWDQWCIASGESIRRKVEDGLGNCTHFVVLLTPQSVEKPWVKEEIDAAFSRKLGSGIKLISLRCELPAGQLPLLLQSALSPEVDAEAFDVSQLINDIHGVTKKPPLGARPAVMRPPLAGRPTFTAAANAVAKLFVEGSVLARKFDPMLSYSQVAERTGLTEDDVRDAVYELRGLVSDHHRQRVFSEDALFVHMDKYWKPWDAERDALDVATALLNGAVSGDPEEVAKHFGWEARRLNPALAYLDERKHVQGLRAMSGSDFILVKMMKNDSTRRFVKSRQ